MKRTLRAALVAIALCLSVGAAARAQTGPYTPQAVPDITQTASILFNNGAGVLHLNGQSTCTVQIVGAWTGVLAFYGTADNVNWNPVQLAPYGGGVPSTSVTSNDLYFGTCAGLSQLEVLATSWTSGTATLAMHGSVGSGGSGGSGGGGGGNVAVTNFPATQTITGNVGITGAVTVGNFPATQTVNGTVSVNNYPATQPVSGTLSVGNFPTSQTVNGTLTVQQPSGTNLHMQCDAGCPGVPWNYFVVAAGSTCVSPAVCVIKASAGTLAALWNNSTSAQSAGNCALYDNAAAASGTPLYVENTIGSGQIIEFTSNGVATSNGLVLQCAVAPTGNGLVVLWK